MRPTASWIHRWLGHGLAALALLCVSPATGAWPAGGHDTLAVAKLLIADDEVPPGDDRAWAGVTLPDNWSTRRRTLEGNAWYRMSFQADPSRPGGVAVFVRRLSMNGEIFVNGVRVLSGGKMTSPVTRNWNHPFFVEVPRSVLRAGTNRLDIRIHAYLNNNGGLGTVLVGDAEALHAEHRFYYALHVKGAIVSFAGALVAAFIGLVAWVRVGRDPVYGLFALSMLAWVVRYFNYFAQDVPIDPIAYALVVNTSQGWFFVFFTPFLLRLTGLHWPRVEWALAAAATAATATMFAAFQGWLPLWAVIAVWLPIWAPGSLALLLVSTRYAVRRRSVTAVAAAIVAWLYVPLTVRELLITSNVVPFDTSYVAHYVGIPLVGLITLMLVDRVVRAVQAAAAAEIGRAQAAFDERQRITQDMHDGLGLQLNTALGLLDRADVDRAMVESSLRACLDELRLIVDSSASGASEFLPVLGTLRLRMQPKLERLGIRIVWSMERFPDDLALPPDVSLQVLRIVQEALNNAVQHAGATVVSFHVEAPGDRDAVTLVVADNGQGFDVDAAAVGRGVSGMKRRAVAARVRLRIDSSGAGTSIRIDLPLSRQGAATPQLREITS